MHLNLLWSEATDDVIHWHVIQAADLPASSQHTCTLHTHTHTHTRHKIMRLFLTVLR